MLCNISRFQRIAHLLGELKPSLPTLTRHRKQRAFPQTTHPLIHTVGRMAAAPPRHPTNPREDIHARQQDIPRPQVNYSPSATGYPHAAPGNDQKTTALSPHGAGIIPNPLNSSTHQPHKTHTVPQQPRKSSPQPLHHSARDSPNPPQPQPHHPSRESPPAPAPPHHAPSTIRWFILIPTPPISEEEACSAPRPATRDS